jgi:hypothetical protein
VQQWCLDAAPDVDRSQVCEQQVAQALIQRLVTDPQLCQLIVADLRDSSQ